MTTHVETWLSDLVNSTRFTNKIEAEIDSLEKPSDRLKARLELLSYVMPKVKGIDPLTPDQTLHTIQIKYVEARPPKKPKGA